MSAGAPEYYLMDFDWDGYTQWTLQPDAAEALLETWVSQVPERIHKLLHFLGTEGSIESTEQLSSAELGKLEAFLMQHGDLYQHKKDQEFYLTDFTFELCKDIAALIGTLSQDAAPTLTWSLNTDRTSQMMYQSIGMVSVMDGDHVPILHLVCEFAEEGLRKRRKVLGAFRKQRWGFLTRLVVMISYEQEATSC